MKNIQTIKNIFLVTLVMYFTLGSSLMLTSVNALSAGTYTSNASESSKSINSKPSVINPVAVSRTSSVLSGTSRSADRSIGSIEDTLKNANSALSTYKTAKTAEKIAKLIDLGTKIIDERISFLANKLSVKVSSEVNISNANKTKLINLINEQISNLQLQRAKIQSLTTLDELKVEVQNVYTSFRIYAVFGPKLYSLLASYRMEFLEVKLELALARVGSTIEANKDLIPNYASISEYLTSAKSELEASKASIASAIIKFNSMLATKDTDPAKALLGRGREDLAKAKQSLNKVKSYLKQISELIDKRNDNVSTDSSESRTSSASAR